MSIAMGIRIRKLEKLLDALDKRVRELEAPTPDPRPIRRAPRVAPPPNGETDHG